MAVHLVVMSVGPFLTPPSHGRVIIQIYADLTIRQDAGNIPLALMGIRRIRLEAQDIALSRQKQGFDSPMRHLISPIDALSYLKLRSCGQIRIQL